MHPVQTEQGSLSEMQNRLCHLSWKLPHASRAPEVSTWPLLRVTKHLHPIPVTEQLQRRLQDTLGCPGAPMLCPCLERPPPAHICLMNSYSSFKTLVAPLLGENVPVHGDSPSSCSMHIPLLLTCDFLFPPWCPLLVWESRDQVYLTEYLSPE